jgi:hypothetical protein
MSKIAPLLGFGVLAEWVLEYPGLASTFKLEDLPSRGLAPTGLTVAFKLYLVFVLYHLQHGVFS